MKIHLISGRRVRAALVAAGTLLAICGLQAAQPDKSDKSNNGHHDNNAGSPPAAGGQNNVEGGAKATATMYGGQAIALRLDGVTKPQDNGPIIICDTGMLPTSGGIIDKTAAGVNIANGALTVGAASANISGIGPEASGETILSNYHGEFLSSENEHFVFDADLIQANVSAVLQHNGTIALTSKVTVQNFRVNGQKIEVTGEPNQKVTIGGTDCWIVFNEQASANENGSGDIGVTAIHFDLCHCIEGHIGFLHAGITAGTTPPEEDHDCGKLTGGGWITGTPDGSKGTFGVSGGIRRDEFWGHLTYIDHGSGMKVESTAVTNYEADADGKSAVITYAVTINGATGWAVVHVTDNGEPGRDDLFDIKLSTGYHAGGDLGGAHSGGGNIQMHKCPPGWE